MVFKGYAKQILKEFLPLCSHYLYDKADPTLQLGAQDLLVGCISTKISKVKSIKIIYGEDIGGAKWLL